MKSLYKGFASPGFAYKFLIDIEFPDRILDDAHE